MSKTIIALGTIALIGALLMANQSESVDYVSKFETFKQKFGKRYGIAEEAYRLGVYTQNLLYAEAYNLQKGQKVFGETIFFDLTQEEFAQTYLTAKVTEEDLNVERVSARSNNLKASIDWSTQGAVTPVKDQGQCGSCWTFSTTGVLESFFYLTTGELPVLSEQQLLDCSTIVDFNLGCDGGLPARALNYVKRNGITTGAAYPYTAVQGSSCRIKGGAYHIKGSQILAKDESTLVTYLNNGPVSVGVDATNWQFYDPKVQKVFSDCDTKMNHVVLAVGYDDQAFKVKNSWSTAWGVKGYIFLARGQNTCGIYDTNVVPI